MRGVDLGQAARWEYSRVVHERYRKAEGKSKGGMLDEFCLNTGYRRKYATRLLNGPWPAKHVEAQVRGSPPARTTPFILYELSLQMRTRKSFLRSSVNEILGFAEAYSYYFIFGPSALRWFRCT
jgi:hypothetical protein